MTLRARRPFGLLLILVLGLAACSGGSEQSPEDELSAALARMAGDGGVTLTARVETDEASLQAAAAEGGEPLPPEVARLVQGLALRLSVPFEEGQDKGVAFGLLLEGTPLVELRAADDSAYLRADVPALLEALGQDPAAVEGLRAMLGEGLPPDALEGRWLALRGAEEMVRQFAGQVEEQPSVDPDAEARAARFAALLAEVGQVERVAAGRLRATMPLRELYDAVLADAAALGLPTGTEAPPRDEIPDAAVAVDLWLSDGRISAAAFDLLQIREIEPGARIPEGVEKLALRLDLSPFDGSITRPADAVDVDAEALFAPLLGGLMGGMLGGMESGMPPGMAPGTGPGTGYGELDGEQAMVPNPVLVTFYDRPGYEQARRRYCEQAAKLPDWMQRHFGDICPTRT